MYQVKLRKDQKRSMMVFCSAIMSNVFLIYLKSLKEKEKRRFIEADYSINNLKRRPLETVN